MDTNNDAPTEWFADSVTAFQRAAELTTWNGVSGVRAVAWQDAESVPGVAS